MMSGLVLFGLLAVLVLLAMIYHKLSAAVQEVRHESRRHADNVILQVEGLLAVHDELRPARALPRTRGWAASPDLLHVLLTVAQQQRPLRVLECSSGLSTLILAAHMRNTGKGQVLSLEHDPVYAGKTRELLQMHGLQDWATVVDAPLVSVELDGWRGRWYDVSALDRAQLADQPVDMVVIDGPPNDLGPLARYPALPVLAPRLAASCTIVLDDSAREAEQQILVRWRSSHPQFAEVPGFDCEKGCMVLRRTAP